MECPETEKQTILQGGNLQYLQIGASHMLTGYDHLLFVFGIVFFLTTFMDVVKTITAFTIGHSITLITATLMGVTVNYFLIDAMIALSVCYIGYENIGGFRKFFKKSPNLIWAVFYIWPDSRIRVIHKASTIAIRRGRDCFTNPFL